MGLFSRKTDEQIIAEGRELYIKGDLSGASLKLGKIARKGHPEACFLIAKIHLEIADKRDRELYTRSAKTFLEKAVEAGHKEASMLMAKKFGGACVETENVQAEDAARAEAKRKAEAEARAKAEAEARAKAEAEAKAMQEPQKPAADSTDKVLEEIHDLEKQIEAAFAEKQAELEKMEQLAAEEQAMKTIDEALQFMEEGKWDEAIQMLLAPAEKGYVLAVYYMAVALASKGEYEQALTWAKIVVNSEIEEEGKKEVNELIKKIEESIKEQQKAEQEKIERQNEIERLKNVTKEGVEAFKAGKAEKALQCWKEAAELGFIPSMFYLAQACSRRGELNEALAWLEKLMKCNLDEARAKKCKEIFDYCVQQKEIYNKALHLYREGKYQEAIENFKISASRGFLKSQIMLADMYSDDQRGQVDENESYKWYRMAAEQGDVESQRIVGIRTFNGTGTDANIEEGIKWLTLAAEQGDVTSQCILADVYYNGYIGEREYDNAYKWYKLAADQGYARGQYGLAKLYKYGWGVEKNYDEAVKWYTLAADQNYVDAQLDLGDFYEFYLKDIGKAIEWYKVAAENGNEKGQSKLVNLYWRKGEYHNAKESFKWCKVLAEAGNVDEQRELGKYYYEGFGTEPNKKEAFRWYKLAAEQGDKYSKTYLAQMYEEGDSISKNKKEAQRLYTEAAEQGEAYALYKVAEMYYTGDGRVKDTKKALELYEDAAVNHFSGDAYYELARFYEYGELVKMDKNKAIKFYAKAITNVIKKKKVEVVKALERMAMQKYVDAACYLGQFYYFDFYGIGVNKKEAFKWYKMAMENGCENDNVAWMLSEMYENGEGTEKDDAKSLYWAQESLRLQHEAWYKEHPEYDPRNPESRVVIKNV